MKVNDDEKPKIDLIDTGLVLGGIAVVASVGWPILLVLGPLYIAQQRLRQSPAVREWTRQLLTRSTGKLPLRLQAPTNTNQSLAAYERPKTALAQHTRQESARPVDPYAHLPFWQRVTMPIDTNAQINQGAVTTLYPGNNKINSDQNQANFLNYALKNLPGYFHYTQLPDDIPSRLSVPIGVNAQDGRVLWGDFDAKAEKNKILHALIAGQTDSGKDSVLRLWFTTLTLNNTPEEIQFVIMDGKSDWLSPALAASAYMARPPVGGIKLRKNENGKRINQAHEMMLESMDWVFDEIERREELFLEAGAITLEAYNKKAIAAGKKTLPMLFLIAADAAKVFDNDLGQLVELLILKGRSYGIRMIISLQDPVGEGTGWRGQISLVMSGFLQDPQHDNRVLGIHVGRMIVRPSQLPNPQENEISRGLFIVRRGSQQYVVRVPHLPEDDWFAYIEDKRFVKRWYDQEQQNSMLSDMLSQGNWEEPKATRRLEPIRPTISEEPKATRNFVTDALTKEQIKLIAQLTRLDSTLTDIMMGLGFTNGNTWRKKQPAVEAVILAAGGRIKR